MAVKFRSMTEGDRAALAAAIDAFLGAFGGEDTAEQALSDLCAGIRDVFLERDCDGDVDLSILALDPLRHGWAILSREPAIPETEEALATAIADGCRELPQRVARLRHLLDRIVRSIARADTTRKTGLPMPLRMPRTAPDGLRGRLHTVLEEQADRGVMISDDGDWPSLHPSLVITLKAALGVAAAAIPDASRIEAVMARRSKGERILVWPEGNLGGTLGEAELRHALHAFGAVSDAIRGEERALDGMITIRDMMIRRREEEAEKARLRADLLALRPTFPGLSEAGSRRIMAWLRTGRPFRVVLSRDVAGKGGTTGCELSDWLGQQGCKDADAAFHRNGHRGLEATRHLLARLRRSCTPEREAPAAHPQGRSAGG